MGLFDKLKKSKGKEIPNNEPPKSGTIEKVPSYVMLIPKDDSVLDDLETLVGKLIGLPFIKVISTTARDDGSYKVALEYLKEEFAFNVSIEDFELPELYRIGHDFTDGEIAVMESAKRGLASSLIFGENNCGSYHLQIKLLCAMSEDPAGIVDFSGERMLCGRWAKLAAQSQVPPAPAYLYVVQGVSRDNGQVWVHTHGLNRCGGIELEILDSDKDNYGGQVGVINTLASRIVSNGSFYDEYEPVYVMRLSPDVHIVATWISWEKAIKMYPDDLLGGMEDRQDGHNTDTGAVYLYKSQEDADKRRISHLGIYNKLYNENAMQMITTEETQRMKQLALERLGYMIKLFEDRERFEDFGILVKVGLEVDDEYKDGDMKEHIWFDLKSVDKEGETFDAELTQEPYYIAALKEGDMRKCRFDEITDWAAFIDGDRITPDSVYRLTE